jgi:hypothetical protein
MVVENIGNKSTRRSAAEDQSTQGAQAEQSEYARFGSRSDLEVVHADDLIHEKQWFFHFASAS